MAATAPKPLRCLVCNQDLDTYQTLFHSVDEHAKTLLTSSDSSSSLIVNVQCEPDNFNLPIGRLILMLSSETTLKELHSFFQSIWLGCSCPKPHEGCFVQDGKEFHLNAANDNSKKQQKPPKLVDADAADAENEDDDDEDNLSVSDFDDDDDDEMNQIVAMSDIRISEILKDEKDWCEYNFDMEKTSCIGLACVKKFEGKKIATNSLSPAILQNTTLPKYANHILVLVRNYRDVKTQQLLETAKNSPRVGMCSALKKLEIGNQRTTRLIGGSGNNQSMVELKEKRVISSSNQNSNSKAKKANPSAVNTRPVAGKKKF